MTEATIEEIKVELSDDFYLSGLLYKVPSADERSPVCLCIHGLGVDSNAWKFVAARLQSRGISALCFDLRGHGLSSASDLRKLNPRQMARDLYLACKKLEIRPTHLLASSLGNYVGLHFLHQYGQIMPLSAFYAVTPVWVGRSKSIPDFFTLTTQTAKFLCGLGKKTGFLSPRKYQRRDHTQYAQFPDRYLPRFVEEASSVSWSRYARLLIWLRLQEICGDFNWQQYAHYPVQMIAAVDEGLWNNKELEIIHDKTGWPLHWVKMNHVSLSTQEKYADELMRILEKEPLFT